MTFEVEAKLHVADAAALRARLRTAGVRLGPPVEQVDTFFGHPGRDLRADDEALRLRRAGGQFELTYKGPRRPGDVKARLEENVVMTKDPTALLRHLGFTPAAHLTKWRESGTLGLVGVALDHVDGLGWFVELEVLAEAAETETAAAAITDAADKLGLGNAPRIRTSYVEMLSRA